MKILLILLLILLPLVSFSQCDSTNVVNFPDEEAQFPGGIGEMKKFIAENIEYPPVDKYDCFVETSRLYFEFIVCKDGTIQNIRLMRPISSEFAEMAINLIEKMPNWIPAKYEGETVVSRCRIPLIICLQ